MTNPITERRYTFSTAVLASGVPPKTIRNWLDRKEIVFDADEEREGGKWRRFSVWDVVRLGLAKPLVDFGMPVSAAGLYVAGALQSCRLLLSYKNTPPDALVAGLQNTSIVFWRTNEGGWDGQYLREDGAPIKEMPPAIALVNVGRIVERVVSVLKEIDETDEK